MTGAAFLLLGVMIGIGLVLASVTMAWVILRLWIRKALR